MNADQRRSTAVQSGHEGGPVRRVAVVLCVVLLASSLLIAASSAAAAGQEGTASTGVASDHTDEEAVIVALDEDGDARFALTVTFNLTNADERASFEELSEATDRQQRLLTRYERRVSNVTAAVENATGREMSVTTPEVETHTVRSGSVGVVELSVTWEGLAATDGDRLRLTAPFDSGFAPDRQLVVDIPDGYRVAETSPEPAATDERLVWESEQSLGSFVLAVEPAAGAGSNETTEDGQTGADGDDGTGPGFGVGAAALALGGLLIVSRRR